MRLYGEGRIALVHFMRSQVIASEADFGLSSQRNGPANSRAELNPRNLAEGEGFLFGDQKQRSPAC
jgi:hypothetical protein